jgi:hypothetical protein
VVDQVDACASKPPVLKNAKPPVSTTERFFSIYADGALGLPHKTIQQANKNAHTGRRVLVGVRFNIDENDTVTVKTRKVE